MHTPGVFAFFIQGGNPLTPPRVKVMVQGHDTDPGGRVFVTPECSSLEELEGHINALQDELDQLRTRAKRAFLHRGGGQPQRL